MGSLSDYLSSPDAMRQAKGIEPLGQGTGTPESDFAANGWPRETVEGILADGARHGKGGLGWKESVSETGERIGLARLSLGGAAAPALIAINLDTGAIAAKIGTEIFEGKTQKEASEKIAQKTQDIGRQMRSLESPEQIGGFQKEALERLTAADLRAGPAKERPGLGEDPLEAWDRDFDRIEAAFGSDPKAFERIRGQYQGLRESEAIAWAKEQLREGEIVHLPGGSRARALSFGGRGAEMVALAPLRQDGSIDEDFPIVARLNDGVGEETLRFNSLEGIARFAAGMTQAELGAEPERSLGLKGLGSLGVDRFRKNLAGAKAESEAAPSTRKLAT